MKELVILPWCDACVAQDEDARIEAEFTDQVASLGLGVTATKLDLCRKHKELLIDPLAELMASHGAPLTPEEARLAARGGGLGNSPAVVRRQLERETSDNSEAHIICPLCGESMRWRSLTGHAKSKHDVFLEKPVYNPRNACPEPGCDFISSATPPYDAQGVATHRSRDHGYNPKMIVFNMLNDIAESRGRARIPA